MAKTVRNVLIALLGLGISASLLLPVVQWGVIKFVMQPEIDGQYEHVASYFPRMLDDLKLLNENPIFSTSETMENAESYLSNHVSWSSDDIHPLDTPSHMTLQELFKKYPEWANDPNQFDALRADPELLNIDTSWMDQLGGYTHWDISTNPMVAADLTRIPSATALARAGIMANLPQPDFEEFRKWAMAHALQKQVGGDTLVAVESLRKAAQLANSTGTLAGNLSASAMLRDERRITNGQELANWQFVSGQAVDAYERMSFGWTGVVQASWFKGLPTEFEPYLHPQNGVCAAASQFSAGLFHFQDFFGDKVLLENDFSQELERSRALQKRLYAECNLTYLEPLLELTSLVGVADLQTVDEIENLPFSQNGLLPLTLKSTQMPYIRRVLGLTLVTLMKPRLNSIYEQVASK